jgi:hypothetical protein
VSKKLLNLNQFEEEVMNSVEKIARCAQFAHEANRIYCQSIGDFSQLHWDEAPEWQRSSALKGVEGALRGNTPEQSHESWLAEKWATGWKYGPVKDAEKKEHPCMVPYLELLPNQKIKDEIFLESVRLMASILEQKVNEEKAADPEIVVPPLMQIVEATKADYFELRRNGCVIFLWCDCMKSEKTV